MKAGPQYESAASTGKQIASMLSYSLYDKLASDA